MLGDPGVGRQGEWLLPPWVGKMGTSGLLREMAVVPFPKGLTCLGGEKDARHTWAFNQYSPGTF